MIAGETPILFSKACELFIIELAYRSWVHTLESNRRTLQVNFIYIFVYPISLTNVFLIAKKFLIL